MGVHTGVEQHQIRLLVIQHLRESVPDGGQVVVISSCVFKRNVDVAGHLAQRKIAGGMDGQGGDARLIGKAGRSAIALMHIQVHHQQPLHLAVVQQHARCCGHVIEDAEPATKAGMGVMGSPCQVTGDSMLKRQASRQQGSPDG